ncbi:MAG: translation initiation factor IF-2 N-terminal domain-containing protein, partial [Myxococcales bacterium]|nr:translation initiation factor IF-2 N-terminal domain-containing protein [Myxococcales bacterium]
MGKRVFEVAKDLGVDHRDLLKKCDALKIKARNYMSVLSDADEARLRGAFESDRKTVERVEGTGGMVRIRSTARPPANDPPRAPAGRGRP